MAYHMNYFIAAISGIMAWSLTEYLLHRFVGHELKTKVRFKKEHLKHHFIINYFAPTKIKFLIAFLVISLTLTVTTPILGFKTAAVFSLSFTIFYLYYEFTHRDLHVREPKTRLGIYLRAHHIHHHQINDKANYGVTTPVWDYVFGTFESARSTSRTGRNKNTNRDHDQSNRDLNKNIRSVT